jgi:TPR repeat protein
VASPDQVRSTVALDTLRERAQSGDARALWLLGRRLLLGLGVADAPQEGYACIA